MATPLPGTPENLAFWKPVLAEVRKRIEARGWWDVTGVGYTAYTGGPTKEVGETLKAIWPDGKWISQEHGRNSAFFGMPIVVNTTVWNEGHLTARGYKGLWVPPKGSLLAQCSFSRGAHAENSDLTVYRLHPEMLIMMAHNGIFPLGIDYWPVKAENGKIVYLCTDSAIGPGCSTIALLAPDPDGAVATERFESFREGIQICEAILFLQRLLEEGKLSSDLAARANRALDERTGHVVRACRGFRLEGGPSWNSAFEGSGWRERDDRLFALCTEASRAAGAN